MTLRRNLLVVFLAIAVLPIAALALLVGQGASRFIEAQAQDHVRADLDVLSRAIDRRLAAERRSLASVVADLTSPYASGGKLGEAFTARIGAEAGAGQIIPSASRFLLMERGRADVLVIESRMTPRGLAFRGTTIPIGATPEPYRRLCDAVGRGDRLPRNNLTVARGRGPAVAIVVPFAGTPAAAPGIVIEEVSAFAFLDELIAQPGLAALDRLFVIARDERGRWSFLHHTDPTLIGLGVDAGDDAFETAALRGDPELGRRVTALREQEATGWRLGAVLSLAPSLAPLRDAIRASLVVFGLMAALVVVAILLVTRGIGGAVEEIAAGAGAVARGDLHRTIRLRRRDEFGAIADHVNQMTRDLLLTAESRSIARRSTRLVHDLKGVASQLNLMLYNLKEHYDDAEFRGEVLRLMHDLVGQIESLALRMRQGGEEGEPEWESVNLDALVTSVLEERIGASWPLVSVEPELSTGAVIATADLLREALGNVITNAVEAMNGRGTVRVRAGRITGRTSPTHFVEVEDTGPGMTREFIDRELFQPFTTTKEKGIGLGMYQTRQAVTRLGGHVEVRSSPGVGTVVRLVFGRRREDREIDAAPRG